MRNTLLFQTFRRRFLLPEYVHDLTEGRIIDLGYNNQFARPLRCCVPGAADGRAFFHDVSFSVVLSVFGETTVSLVKPPYHGNVHRSTNKFGFYGTDLFLLLDKK